MLHREAGHEIPPIIKTIVDGNWLASAQQMLLGLHPIRIFAIVREIISSFMSEGHFMGYPGRIIRPDAARMILLRSDGQMSMLLTAAFVPLFKRAT
eukprot:7313759-Pyramimonas_sp.AAC.1